MKKMFFAGALIAFALPFAVSAKTVDRTPPSIVSLHIASDAANPSQAASGNTVTLSFTTSEPVEAPIVLVNARPVILRATNGGGNAWGASYTITGKDPLGSANYLVTLEDTSGNLYACSNVKTLFQILVKYCPPTDGSSVTVVSSLGPPADTQPPVIAPVADISVEAASYDATGATVTYTTPTATDNVDGTSDVVSCTPASGSTFNIGTTTVTCNAQDAAGNHAVPVTFKVGVYLPPAPDTQPPVIAPHNDVSVTLAHAADTSATVTYATPTATDNVDGTSDVVSCTPASGSTFNTGTTQVTCNAQDAAGNHAVPTTFNVIINPFVPQAVTVSQQPDQSLLCPSTFNSCFAGGNIQTYNLGQLSADALSSVTISLDSTYASLITSHPWIIYIECFTDASYTTACPDWVQSNAWNSSYNNGNSTNSIVVELANSTSDNQHWTANFTTANEVNYNGSSPVVFNPNYYYQLVINDDSLPIYAWGNAAGTEPYWDIEGLTQ